MITKEIELTFGTVTILNNLLIAKLNEGVLFDVESNRKLLEIGKEVFQGRDYGYISHRIHSYAVDPMVYLESANVSNLKAIAVVSASEMTRKNAKQLEQKFYKNANSFEIFEDLEEAKSWIESKI